MNVSHENNFLKIDKKELQNYLQISKEKEDFRAKIRFQNYTDLGSKLNSLIGVCRSASMLLAENSEINDAEKETLFGSSNLSIANVLELAQNIIPFHEFEFLDKIQNEISTN